MSFGASTSKQSSHSSQTIDPGILGTMNANIDATKALAAQPYQPYTGQVAAGTNGYTQKAAGAAQGLLGYAAPKVSASTYNPATGSAAQVDRSKIGNVNTGLLSDLDLTPYRNQYTTQVVDAAIADSERGRKLARMADADAAGAASAFGGSRHGVLEAETNRAYDDNSFRNVAQLRSDAEAAAVNTALADLDRRQRAEMANQGVDLNVETGNAGLRQDMELSNLGFVNSAGQFNAGQTQAADLANQDASIRGAGVQAQVAGLLGDIGSAERAADQAALDRRYAVWQDEQQRPTTMQQLLNQSIGLLPNPVLTSSSSKGSSSSVNFTRG